MIEACVMRHTEWAGMRDGGYGLRAIEECEIEAWVIRKPEWAGLCD